MHEEHYLMLAYDENKKVPIALSKVDTKIKKEIRRLARLTGLPGENLPIEYVRNPNQDALGWFSNCLPYKIVFNLDSLEKCKVSPRQLIEITQHEFAHYVQKLLYDIDMADREGHGPDFTKACKKVGCSDSRYFNPKAYKLFNL